MRADGPRGIPIDELARLIRGLEAGGIYNGAKLVRALLERELAQIGADGVRDDGPTISAGVTALADRLDAIGEDPALVAALRAAARAAAEGATLALADAPRVWVCRTCGRISLTEPPGTCPGCEAPTALARELPPIWFFEPLDAPTALDELEGGEAALLDLVAGRVDAALALPPRPGEWSVRETLEHLVAAEELLATRVPRMLDEDDPDLVAAAAWILPSSDEATTATESPASALLARHRAMREATLARLRRLDDAGWRRSGRHPEWGTVTVLSQAGYFARHLWSHIAQIRAGLDGRVPGEHAADR